MNEENMALRAFRQYGDQVLRLAYCYTGNVHEAEKITESVFLTFSEQRSNEKERIVLLHEAAKQGRSRRRQRRGAIAELPEECAAVLYLHDHERIGIPEISAILGGEPQYMETLLEQGRKLLGEEGNI